MPELSLSAFRDRFVAADPGLTRLLLAARVTVSVALAVAAIAALATILHFPLSVGIVAAVVAMQTSLAINDAAPKVTTLLVPLPATLGVVLGALTSSRGWLADIVFLIVLFVAVAIRQYGPRWTVLGTIATLTYFIALFLGATVSQLPTLIAAIAAAVAATYLVRFGVVRDVPEWTARRMLDAFAAQLRLVVGSAREIVDAVRDDAGRDHRTRAALLQLNDTALAIEGRLPEEQTVAAAIVFDAELAAENLMAAAPRLRGLDAATLRPIRVALSALTHGSVERAARIAKKEQALPHAPAAISETAAALEDLCHAFKRLKELPDAMRGSSGSTRSTPPPQQPPLRQAVQVTVAAAAAIGFGELLSPQRWYWAVLAAYFVFIGTASSGETLVRAWARTVGTALGVALGILAGHLAQHHDKIAVALIFAFLFLGVYFLRVSYGAMIFFITALLSLLWALLGRFSDGLLVIRLLETVIGAACGALAATLIFPTRTGDVISHAVRATVDAIDQVVHTAIADLIDTKHDEDAAIIAARALDETLQDLSARSRPVMAGRALTARGRTLRRWVVGLHACGFYARNLARAVDREPSEIDDSITAALRAVDAAMVANLRAAAAHFDGEAGVVTTDARPALGELQQVAHERGTAGTAIVHAAHLLDRLDRAIVRLAHDDEPAPAPQATPAAQPA